ncbi:MAG: hypothetical protein WCJ93_10165 [Methanomicrobiales archaeon]
MEKNRFTGYCTVSFGLETCTIVLNSGINILADYDKLEGEHAWQKMQKLLEMKVDAGLTTLNTAQLELAREFNPHATLPSFVRKSPTRQVRTGTTSPGTRRKDDRAGNAVPGVRSEHLKNNAPNTGPQPSTAEQHPDPGISTPVPAQFPGDQQPSGKGPEEGGTNIERDLKALDNMDIDEMTKKIRENCKVTIEQMDLDHLLGNRED